uniref:Uncharacterized protein n=1 Tax=Rhizophora mucronata TaxID=61149 RepID=A0A2P2Q9K5_RHIMU
MDRVGQLLQVSNQNRKQLVALWDSSIMENVVHDCPSRCFKQLNHHPRWQLRSIPACFPNTPSRVEPGACTSAPFFTRKIGSLTGRTHVRCCCVLGMKVT